MVREKKKKKEDEVSEISELEDEVPPMIGQGPQNGLQSFFSNIFATQDASIQKEIVGELLSADNLDRKTELDKPFRWAALSVIKNYLKSHDMINSAKIIFQFRELSFRYLISKKRQGRKEYLEALHALPAPENSSPGEGSDSHAY